MKNTIHTIEYKAADNLRILDASSIDLVVTSPPYPMIQMWDNLFMELDSKIGNSFDKKNYSLAFEQMHTLLDKVWKELYRIVKPGGIVCINIGDATRTLDKNFQLFSSHSRILSKCVEFGFQNLPNIIWRKTTNAPNKFMGSGMLPPGAYVTLEHEYILIFRKGEKREFKTESEKELRRESAFFWEERNNWFSDVWHDLRGVSQELNDKELRKRSAAYPLDLAFRLINMFSIKGDMVLDPFLGTGTTTYASMIAERNSVGFEIKSAFHDHISEKLRQLPRFANNYIEDRIQRHENFVKQRIEQGKEFKFEIKNHKVPCISRQEVGILIRSLSSIEYVSDNCFEVAYKKFDKSTDVRHSLNQNKNSKNQSNDQVTLKLT